MSKITSVRRCYHCGKPLQDEDPTKEGYIQSAALNKRQGNEILLCL
ncbi:MAG: ribosome biogenesis GTPase YqeH, partial [Enterococcus sp.]|nr:ribosome biogenesis GTPase YqeH [Enterococcus sp.]